MFTTRDHAISTTSAIARANFARVGSRFRALTLCRVFLVIAAATTWGASSAFAAAVTPGSQFQKFGLYGEVWQGGGFDSSAYNGGEYGGALTPGEFVDPVGFAVDTHDGTPGGDGTAIYVLDRTSALPTGTPGTTSWRLQKLSDQGVVLGTDLFTLPDDGNYYEMLGLAVEPGQDGSPGEVYSLLIGFGATATVSAEVTDEVLAWSTAPSEGQLVPAAGLTLDAHAKGIAPYPTPAVFSSSAQLDTARGHPLVQGPEGIALAGSGSSQSLAILDTSDNADGTGAGITELSLSTGAVTGTWSSHTLANDPLYNGDDTDPPLGISTAANGALTVLLGVPTAGIVGATPGDIAVADVAANLTSQQILSNSNSDIVYPDNDENATDEAAIFASGIPDETINFGGASALTTLASPQIVQLSNGLYAGEFEAEGQPYGPNPENPTPTPVPWTLQHPGIRLLDPTVYGGVLTGTNVNTAANAWPLGSLYDTLGNATVGAPCSLSDAVTAAGGAAADPNPSLAAGANGSIWILTRGSDSSDPGGPDPTGGRQLIELAPGAANACPAPSGTFTMSDNGGAPQPASTDNPILASPGDTVTVCAVSYVLGDCPAAAPSAPIDYQGAATAQFTWDWGDGTPPDVIQMRTNDAGVDQWPPATDTHQYGQNGNYIVTLTVSGDFGTYIEQGAVDVGQAVTSSAAFTYSPMSPQTGSAVVFDASGSTPAPGATIDDYQWNWGDGMIDETGSPTDYHTYEFPGTYTVTLRIRGTDQEVSPPMSEVLTVADPPPAPPPTTTATTTTATTPPVHIDPANYFTLAHKRIDGHSIVLGVVTPGPGRVRVSASFSYTVRVKRGKRTRIEHEHARFALLSRQVTSGTSEIRVSPSAAALSQLRGMTRRERLEVSLTVTFTPTGGQSSSRLLTAVVNGIKR